jgi:uncharacterized protein YhaN
MRLTGLDFHRVGCWSDLQPIRLGSRVTVILGDNEAGKSTAMRAVEALLFGPTKALVAPLASEQLFDASATALLGAGEELRWSRHGRAIDPPEAEEQLRLAAPEAAASRFRELFRLGHADVKADPKVFLSESGSIGRVLFAASSGAQTADLAALEKELDTRRKTAESAAEGKDGLKRRLDTYRALKAGLEQAAHFAAFDGEHARLQEQQAKIDGLSQQIAQLDAELLALKAFSRGLPAHAALATAEEALRALETTGPLPPSGWAERIETARARWADARGASEEAREKQERLAARLAAMPPIPKLLAYAAPIRQRAKRLGAFAKDREALDAARSRLSSLQRELLELLADLGAPNGGNLIGTAEALCVRGGSRDLFEGLLTALHKASEAREAAEAAVVEARGEVSRAEASRPAEAGPAAAALEPSRELTAQLAKTEAELARFDQEAAEERALALEAHRALGTGEEAPEKGAALPVAERAAIKATHDKLVEAEQQEAAGRKELETAKQRAAKAAELVQLTHARSGSMPSAAELASARAERREAFEALRATWDPAWQPGAELRLPALAAALDTRIARADDVADRRFADAELAGKLESAERASQDAQQSLEKTRERVDALSKALADATAEWDGLWSFLPRPPTDHAEWLNRHESLCEHLGRWEQLAAEASTQREKRDRMRRDLSTQLSGILPEAARLETATAIEAALDREKRRRDELEEEQRKQAAALQARQENLQTRATALELQMAALERAQRGFDKEAATLPQAIGRTPVEVEHWLTQQSELERLRKGTVEAQQSVKKLEASISELEDEAKKLIAETRQADPELGLPSSLSPCDAIAELERLVEAAEPKRQEREEAEKALRQAKLDHTEKEKALSARAQAIDVLWKSAGVSAAWTEEALGEAAERSRRADELQRERAEQRRALEKDWPMGIEKALATIAGRGADALEIAARDMSTQKQALHGQREEALQEKGRIQAAIGSLEKPLSEGTDAQALALCRSRALAKAEEAVTLRAAIWLLEQAKKRATESSRPLVDEASHYFERLTDGLYRGLDIDRSGKEPTLWAIPASGPAKAPGQLSDGTLDQIWLSLRLAVARQAARETPFPLLLDDVFVHFDDTRTSSALKLLAELSEQMQVIVFTHHDHVVDLAQAAIPEALQVVVLARPEAPKHERLIPKEPARHERPPAPVAAFDDALPESGAPEAASGTLEEACEAVLSALRSMAQPASKAELIEHVAGDGGPSLESRWSAVLKQLKAEKRIVQVGEKKGARYSLAPEGA